MGGSGGFSGYGTISAKAQMLASETGAQSSQQEIEINEFLEALLKDFNIGMLMPFKRTCRKSKKSLEGKLMV